MDHPEIQAKMVGFANRLLEEAEGDPVRALGLLVLVLEGLHELDTERYAQLVSEVRKILLPDEEPPHPERAIQHLAGELSWEGYQHCLRCGYVLVRKSEPTSQVFPSGFVYQIGRRLSMKHPGEYCSCVE